MINFSNCDLNKLYTTVLTKDWIVSETDSGSTKLSLIDIFGRRKELVLPTPPQDFEKSIKLFIHGYKIQNAFPSFTHTQREFMLTGMDDEEWDDVMGEE